MLSSQVKFSADRQTDRRTDRRTPVKQYALELSMRGHIKFGFVVVYSTVVYCKGLSGQA